MSMHLQDKPETGNTIISIQVESSEEKDKKFINLDEENSNIILEITDYDLGIEPSWIITGKYIIIGFGLSLFQFDAENKSFSKMVDLDAPFFEFLPYKDKIIVICEYIIFIFDMDLCVKKIINLGDIITKWEISNNRLIYNLYEGETGDIMLDQLDWISTKDPKRKVKLHCKRSEKLNGD